VYSFAALIISATVHRVHRSSARAASRHAAHRSLSRDPDRAGAHALSHRPSLHTARQHTPDVVVRVEIRPTHRIPAPPARAAPQLRRRWPTPRQAQEGKSAHRADHPKSRKQSAPIAPAADRPFVYSSPAPIPPHSTAQGALSLPLSPSPLRSTARPRRSSS